MKLINVLMDLMVNAMRAWEKNLKLRWGGKQVTVIDFKSPGIFIISVHNLPECWSFKFFGSFAPSSRECPTFNYKPKNKKKMLIEGHVFRDRFESFLLHKMKSVFLLDGEVSHKNQTNENFNSRIKTNAFSRWAHFWASIRSKFFENGLTVVKFFKPGDNP